MNKIIAAMVLMGVAGIGVANAEEKPRLDVTQQNTQEKARFVSNLLNKSVASKELEEGQSQSQSALDDAKALLAEAEGLLQSGKAEAADAKLNKAIGLMAGETRRVSGHEVGQARSAEIYQSRRESVVALLDAYSRVAEEKGRSGEARQQRQAIETALSEGDAMAERQQYDQALGVAEDAYRRVSAKVAELRNGDRLVKELKFDNAEDEYIYEIDRNDTHFYLLKLTLDQGKAHASMLPHIEKLRGEAQTLRTQAERKADGGKHGEAIDTLDQSTVLLIKALRMGGAYIPG